MVPDPARVAARLAGAAETTATAADLVFHLCTDFRAGRRVEPLDPASLAAEPTASDKIQSGLDELHQAIRDEYGRDLRELTVDEAWPLLDALASALASLARESSKSSDADIEAKLAALRQLRPSASK